ncbi:MAG: PGF-pre-PGF domain-containing protein, partial [Candidatus Methanoperedens sp.]
GYTWFNDGNRIQKGDRFDNMTVGKDTWDGLTQHLNLTNSDSPITLPQDSTVQITGDLYFKVLNTQNLSYYPYFNRPRKVNTIDITDDGSKLSLDISVNESLPVNVNITEMPDLTPGMSSDLLGFKSMNRLMDINLSGGIRDHLEWVKFRIYYTQEELVSSGLDEASLKLLWYNETSGKWEIIPQQGVDTADTGAYAGYVWANLTHLSTFALVGSYPAPTPTTTSPPSGSSGGGGGGGASGEDYANIEIKEKYDLHIFKDKVTSYKFTSKKNPILFINITGNTSAGEVTATVEMLRNTSSLVKSSPHGIVYKNINIWVGTSGFAVPRNIKEAVIGFRVENSWLNNSKLAGSDIKMVRWDGNGWITLETTEKSRDSTYTYYEAKTDSFSSFAIAGFRDSITTAAPSEANMKQAEAIAPAQTEDQTKKAAGFG